jgi:Etoposide-induced protein 2.4 (EI24)
MNLMLNSFWRAAAYCLHPRVIALSFLPLIIMVGLALGVGYFFWEPVLEWVRLSLDSFGWMTTIWTWLQNNGMGSLKTVLVPLLVIFAITPLVVILSLILVALLMTPAMVSLVAERRFPKLERKKGASFTGMVGWSFSSTLIAILAMLVSIPLWFIPPLILIVPPLIWGWLTYRVMSFDAIAEHASKQERKELMKNHRGNLLVIGVISGYLGAAPSLVWASGALFAAAFVILVPIAIWIYTLVFGFASLWFSHYCLAALAQMRAEKVTAEATAEAAKVEQELAVQAAAKAAAQAAADAAYARAATFPASTSHVPTLELIDESLKKPEPPKMSF